MTVIQVGSVSAAAAIDVLCEAFHDYPVVRFVIGSGDDYARRVRWLMGVSVAARALRRDPVLGVTTPAAGAVAAALVTLPGSGSPAAGASRDRFWQAIGDGARDRWETYQAAVARFAIREPHHRLDLLGVKRSHRGVGLARVLVEAVEALAYNDPSSAGVSLMTESASNVPLYQHFGYELRGYARIADNLETWAFFKPVNRTSPVV